MESLSWHHSFVARSLNNVDSNHNDIADCRLGARFLISADCLLPYSMVLAGIVTHTIAVSLVSVPHAPLFPKHVGARANLSQLATACTYNAPLVASWSNRASNILPGRILKTNAIVRHPRLRRPSTCISPCIYTRMANGTAIITPINFHPHQSSAQSIPHYDYMRRTYIFSPCLNAGLLHGG